MLCFIMSNVAPPNGAAAITRDRLDCGLAKIFKGIRIRLRVNNLWDWSALRFELSQPNRNATENSLP